VSSSRPVQERPFSSAFRARMIAANKRAIAPLPTLLVPTWGMEPSDLSGESHTQKGRSVRTHYPPWHPDSQPAPRAAALVRIGDRVDNTLNGVRRSCAILVRSAGESSARHLSLRPHVRVDGSLPAVDCRRASRLRRGHFPGRASCLSLIRQLTWTHFITLIPLKDLCQRDCYAQMASTWQWRVQMLRERIDSMYQPSACS
jgi:hypothetical protein